MPPPSTDGLVLVVSQIETLKMGWCHLGPDDGAKAVADLLMFNSTLVVLDLRGNGLGNAGIVTISNNSVACTCLHVCGCVAGLHSSVPAQTGCTLDAPVPETCLTDT